LAPASQLRNSFPSKIANIEAMAMHRPPPTPNLEDLRLEVARRQVEARTSAVKENLALLEQFAREIKQGDFYGDNG
jgi:hypothetical protein